MAVSKIPMEGAGTATYNTSNHEFKYAKKNGWVLVYGVGGSDSLIQSGQTKVLGTLPEGYRPPTAVNFVGVNRVGTNNAMSGDIGTDGRVQLTADGASAAYWYYSVAFPL